MSARLTLAATVAAASMVAMLAPGPSPVTPAGGYGLACGFYADVVLLRVDGGPWTSVRRIDPVEAAASVFTATSQSPLDPLVSSLTARLALRAALRRLFPGRHCCPHGTGLPLVVAWRPGVGATVVPMGPPHVRQCRP